MALKTEKLTARGRETERADDKAMEKGTSFTTYLEGELKTYSERMLSLYEAYVDRLKGGRYEPQPDDTHLFEIVPIL